MPSLLLRTGLAVLACLAFGLANAQQGPDWASLTPAQQSALAPLKPQWSTIDAARKTKWLAVAQRFPSMPPEERTRVQERMAEWATLSPGERGRARQNFQELRNLPASDRQALWEAYRALPDEERAELAKRAKPPAPKASDAPVTAAVKKPVPVAQAQVTVKPVTPTVVQAKPGASTTLLTKSPAPPAHTQPGLPKIAATDTFVNKSTLLPRRGPQGAAVHSASAPASVPADHLP